MPELNFKFDTVYPPAAPVVVPVITNSPVSHQVARPLPSFSPNYTQNDAPARPFSGYVPNNTVRSGYLPQREAFAVRTSVGPSPAGTPDDTRPKVPVAGLTDGKMSGKFDNLTIVCNHQIIREELTICFCFFYRLCNT